MQKHGRLKSFFIVGGFLLFMAMGFLSVNVMTSCRSEAQTCHCGICTYIPGGMVQSLWQIDTTVTQPGILIAVATLEAYFVVATVGYMLAMEQKIYEVTKNQIAWWDTFWFYNLLPAMQDMTDQLNTMDVNHMGAVGRFEDVMDENRTNRLHMKKEIEAHRMLRPSESVCQAGTIAGGMARARAFRKAYNASAPAEQAGISGNEKGSPAAQGAAQYQQQRWTKYLADYCDKDYNFGSAGCAASAPNANRDLDVTGEIFAKETIDLKDPTTKKVIDDLIQNIAEPVALNPVPPSMIDSPTGHEVILARESYRAKRQTIYDALYQPVARRAPGSNMKAFLEPMEQAAGYDPSMISANPSHNEIMQVMMSERFRTGKYAVSQVDEPENNAREMVTQQAFQAMQMNDMLDLMDRYSLLLAAATGDEVNAQKQAHGENEEGRAKQ